MSETEALFGVLRGTRSAQSIRASGFTAAQTGRTHDRTRPMLQQRQKVLAKAPSTRHPKRTWRLRIAAAQMDNLEKVLERMGTTDNLTWALRVPFSPLQLSLALQHLSQLSFSLGDNADEVPSVAMLHF